MSQEQYTALIAERDALRQENGQLRELLNVYNLGGWTDAERLMKERDALRKYARHAVTCLAGYLNANGAAGDCDCGLSALLLSAE